MSNGWSWAALLFAATLFVPGAHAATPPTPTPDVLYLEPAQDAAPLPNFTTEAPDADGPVKIMPTPILTGSGEVVWKWIMHRSPAAWTAPAGGEFTATLHLLRLDRVVPVSDPREHPDGMARLKLQVEVLRGSSDTPIGRGQTYLPYDPTASYESPITATVRGTIDDDTTFDVVPGDAPLFGIKVTLTGQARNHDPPLLLVASQQTPSHVSVPGFPVSAFAAWEHAEAEAARCNERTLQGLPCHDVPAPTAPAPTARSERSTGVPPLSAQMATADGLAVIGVGFWVFVSAITRHVLGRWR